MDIDAPKMHYFMNKTQVPATSDVFVAQEGLC